MFTVTAWKNGPHGPDTLYGLRIREPDRARYFRRRWQTVHLRLPGGHGVAAVALSPSFWRSCPELRSERIGEWLRTTGAAPWSRGRPPRYTLRPAGEDRFSVEML
ncbi:MAG: hypothetical protein ACE5JQ_07980 [Candidatus Methylomirabilales bacterium]